MTADLAAPQFFSDQLKPRILGIARAPDGERAPLCGVGHRLNALGGLGNRQSKKPAAGSRVRKITRQVSVCWHHRGGRKDDGFRYLGGPGPVARMRVQDAGDNAGSGVAPYSSREVNRNDKLSLGHTGTDGVLHDEQRPVGSCRLSCCGDGSAHPQEAVPPARASEIPPLNSSLVARCFRDCCPASPIGLVHAPPAS
jgi:hypothetical protein